MDSHLIVTSFVENQIPNISVFSFLQVMIIMHLVAYVLAIVFLFECIAHKGWTLAAMLYYTQLSWPLQFAHIVVWHSKPSVRR